MYGLVKVTGSCTEDHDVWKVTCDPEDMLKPAGLFAPAANNDLETVRAALAPLYPKPAAGSRDRLHSRYGNSEFVVRLADEFAIQDRYRGLTRQFTAIAERAGKRALVYVDYGSMGVLQKLYKEPEYASAPITVTCVNSAYVAVKPDARSAATRVKRTASARARAEKKQAAAEVRRVQEEALERLRAFRRAAAELRKNVLNDCPEVAAMCEISLLYDPDVPVPVEGSGEPDYRKPHPARWLRAAWRFHRARIRRDWRAREDVRRVAALVTGLGADGLLGSDEFDPVHADDRADLLWLVRESRRTTREAAAELAAAETPKPTEEERSCSTSS